MSLSIPSRSPAQVLARSQLFTSVQPCRVADTRSATAGILLGGVPRAFNVVGPINYSSQGGVPGGCAIPGFAGGLPQVQAVVVNIVAVDPSGDGFLTAWPTDQAFPPASTVNFQKLVPNLNIANGVIVPVRQDVQGGDITIVAGVSNAHVIVDISGYFTTAQPRKYYLTKNPPVNGSQPLNNCANGYHMASLWEIFDTTDLAYDAVLGYSQADNGAGPASQEAGWVRTGFNSNNSVVVGQANCNAWTSNMNADRGTLASLSNTSWQAAATLISPWIAGVSTCDTVLKVWCVQD